MGKSKDKKKNKLLRKDKHKEKAKKQHKILLQEVDIEQVENQQEVLPDEVDKEQRRTTRLGAIIAIVAIVGALCTFLFKMTINTLNVWSKQGLIYWYLQVLFLSALSISVIIFIDIVTYVICDLKRHNIVKQNYKQYDEISDGKYENLLTEFKMYISMLFLIYSLAIPLSGIYADKEQKWSSIVATIVLVISGILFLVRWIKKQSREDIKKVLKYVVVKIIKGVLVGLFCLAIGITFVTNNKAMIEIDFNKAGIIEICNTSADSYKGLEIKICNMDDDVIYEKSVEKEDVLLAREFKYIKDENDGKKVAEGIIVNSEWLHWKYIFELKKIMNESGKYYISITVHQEGKSVVLLNSFLVDDKEFIFAQDNIQKEY